MHADSFKGQETPKKVEAKKEADSFNLATLTPPKPVGAAATKASLVQKEVKTTSSDEKEAVVQDKQELRSPTLESQGINPMLLTQKERVELCCTQNLADVDPICFNQEYFDGNCPAIQPQQSLV